MPFLVQTDLMIKEVPVSYFLILLHALDVFFISMHLLHVILSQPQNCPVPTCMKTMPCMSTLACSMCNLRIDESTHEMDLSQITTSDDNQLLPISRQNPIMPLQNETRFTL